MSNYRHERTLFYYWVLSMQSKFSIQKIMSKNIILCIYKEGVIFKLAYWQCMYNVLQSEKKEDDLHGEIS